MIQNLLIRMDYGGAISKVIHKVPSWIAMPMLNKILGLTTPFNKQLGAQIDIWDSNSCEISIKTKRKLKNHLGSLHAGAIATIGEMTAGMLLLRNINLQENRIILKELNVVYHKQIYNNCRAISSMDPGFKKNLREELQSKGEIVVRIQSNLMNEKDILAASVRTIWQIKNWNRVRS